MSCRGGVGHIGVGWGMSWRGGVGHTGVGWGGSYRGGVCHAGVGWVTQGWDDTYRALSPSAHCTMW